MDEIGALVTATLAAGRGALLEHEAYLVAQALGLAVPKHLVVPAGAPAPAREALPGDRLVVKVLSPVVLHKSDRGGVRVASRESVADTLAEMGRAFAGADLHGFLVAEYLEHPPEAEILLGVRRTAEFGPVVALGMGGVRADLFASALPPCLFRVGEGHGGVRRAVAEHPGGARSAGQALTGGRRGLPPAVEPEVLDAFLRRFLTRAAALPPAVADFEVNPLVFVGGRPVALDALVRLGTPPATAPPRPLPQIERLLRPQSIAVVGVSGRMNPGRVILRNILAAGFPGGGVTVVKSGSEAIDGCRCVPDLAALPPVDLLVLSIAAEGVPAALEDVVARGSAAAVIVIPGGLGERQGSEALAARVRAAVLEGRRRGTGPVVAGGNSMGIRSVPGRYDATFIPGYKSSPATDAETVPLAVVSQSGAFAIARLDRFPALRPRYLITVGNQADLTVGDFLEHLAGDPAVEVVACYVEGFCPGDGSHFLEGARRLVGRGGAVVAYLAGRTEAGAASAASHTASIAPDHVLARTLAEQAGALAAVSLEEFEDLVRLTVLLSHRRVDGMNLGATSNAGFEAVAIADAAAPLSLARLGSGTAARIGAILEEHRLQGVVGVGNPLDLTPITDDEGFVEAAAAVLADDGVDVAIVGCVPLTPALATLPAGPAHGEDLAAPGSLASRLIDLWRSTSKAWVIVVDGGALYDPLARRLEQAGLPVFRAADRAATALARYCRWRVAFASRSSSGSSGPVRS